MEEPVDTKVAVVLLEDLLVWQKANAAAFLVSGIAGSARLVGEEAYVDASGNRYLPMLRQPILIYTADSSGIRRAYERAMAREVEQLLDIPARALLHAARRSQPSCGRRGAVRGTRPRPDRSTGRSQD